MSSYARGAARERQVVELFKLRGWFAIRAAGSHGPADVVAVRNGHQTLLIQVKTDVAGPYAHFGPNERKELREACRIAGARGLLLWWPPHGAKSYIFEEGWPD